MLKIISAVLALAMCAACSAEMTSKLPIPKMPVRGKGVPVDHYRGKTLYQVQCKIDAAVRGLPKIMNHANGKPANSCVLKAMATCNSDYRILHRQYGEAHWRILNTHDRVQRIVPHRYRQQDLTIEFICMGEPRAAAAPPPAPIRPADLPAGAEFYTK